MENKFGPNPTGYLKMKYVNYYVDYMVYVSLLGKSLFEAFGKSFLGFRKIFTPDTRVFQGRLKDVSREISVGFKGI